MAGELLQFPYGFGVKVDMDCPTAESKIRPALATEGFGILTEIDVAATLHAKIGVERTPYKILGACNPRLANRALTADDKIGLLLPCNVIVYAVEGGTMVAAVDPATMVQMSPGAEMEAVSKEAKERLSRALLSLRSA